MTPQIPQSFRQTLAELELLSHGACQSFNADMTHGGERDQRPKGELHPPHLTYREDWLKARDNAKRAQVEHDAETELQSMKKRQAPLQAVEFDWRAEVIDNMAGLSPKEIALRVKGCVTERQVMRWRAEDALDPSTGNDPVTGKSTRERVLELDAKGYSQSQIRMITGQSRQAVSVMLKRAS